MEKLIHPTGVKLQLYFVLIQRAGAFTFCKNTAFIHWELCWNHNLSILSFFHISTFLSISNKQPPIFFNLCVNAPLKTWKSNPRQTIGHSWHENCIYHGGNVFKRMNGAFSHRLLHKQGVKRTISTVNWKNRRWKRNFIVWIEFLGHECLKKLNQKEDNAINEQEIVVKAMFM